MKTPADLHMPQRAARRLTGALAVLVTVSATAAVVGCEKKEKKPEPKAYVAPKATTSASSATPAKESPLGEMKYPVVNPQTKEKVALGNRLFFDKKLSVDGSRACYSCHLNEDGTGGHEPTAIGAKDKKLTRHAPTMWNVGYLPVFYWDGRADSLEGQMKGAWGGGNMGVGKENLAKKAEEIAADASYKAAFDKAFPGKGVTPDTIAMAVAAYERTLICDDTAWDKFNAGDKSAMTDEQQKGYKLFIGKAACNSCHTPPFFSDSYTAKAGAFHNAGIGTEGKKESEVDVGRQKISKSDSEWAAFKTPSLRNVAKSAPYFHDGSVKTLEEAVKLMAAGGIKNKNLDSRFKNRELSDAEIKQIVAFLGALDCNGKLTAPK